MVLSLVELTYNEKETIGRSIVGLEKPDLSMFPIGVRDEILNYSIEYLVKQLKHIAPAAAAKRIPPLMELVTQSSVKEHLKWDIEEAAESLEDNAAQDNLFAYLGNKEELLEKARRQIKHAKVMDLNSDLDYILSLYKLAGETLDSKDIQKIALTYLFESINPTRVVQVHKKFKEVGIELKLKRSNLPEIIRACESQYDHILSTPRDKEDYVVAGEAIRSILPFSRVRNSINRIKDNLDIAEKAASLNCFNTAYFVASGAFNIIEKEKPLAKAGYAVRLEAIADKLIQSGFFSYSKDLYAKLGKEFDNKKAYSIFIEKIRKGYQNRAMLSYLLNNVSNQELRDFADNIYNLIKTDSSFRRKEASFVAYAFVLRAYRKLNEKELAAEVEQKMKEQELLSDRKRAKHTPPEEEVKIPQKNLGDVLLEMEGFVDNVVKAYDTGGLAAVQKVIQSYGSRLTEKDFTHTYCAHPVEIIEGAFSKIGRDMYDKKVLPEVKDEYALEIVRYALVHGVTQGTGYGSYHKLRGKNSDHLREQTNPVAWALGIVNSLLEDYKNKSEAVELAEMAAKLGNTDVPPILYRIAAAEYLGHITQQPRGFDKDFMVDQVSAYSAWEYYKKVGDKGLILFVKTNFLKGVDLAK